jgi:signal transduction histidine kinase
MQKRENEAPLFTHIFDQIFTLIPCVQSSIYLLDGADLRYVASRGVLRPELIHKLNFPLEGSGGAKVSMEEDRPVLVADVKGEEELARVFQDSAKMAPEKTYDFIGSWMCAPIHIGGQVRGLLDVCHSERGFYTGAHVEALRLWIGQVESTIENAILLTDLSQRSAELEMLNTIQQAIYSKLDLNDVLQLVADHALHLTSARQIAILVGDEEKLTAVTCAGNHDPLIQPGFTLSPGSTLIASALRNRQAVRVLNVNRDGRIDPAEAVQLGICSLLAIPLQTALQPNAVLMAIGDTFGAFSPNDERVVSSLAAAAAIGIDNAQLYQRERELVRLQERQRIAQNLHDTVTQLLFRTGLEAKWCLQNLDLAPEAQARMITIQHLLTRSSYEMRSAIFALNQHEMHKGHSLLDLLQDLIADFQHQCGINATLIARDDLGDLPFSMVEAIYRLTREALNNVYKHSNATAAFVSLKREESAIILTVQDDGAGLPEGQPLDAVESSLHFGLSSMRQLVAPFGGQFTIQNNDEEGVIVKAVFQMALE